MTAFFLRIGDIQFEVTCYFFQWSQTNKCGMGSGNQAYYRKSHTMSQDDRPRDYGLAATDERDLYSDSGNLGTI